MCILCSSVRNVLYSLLPDGFSLLLQHPFFPTPQAGSVLPWGSHISLLFSPLWPWPVLPLSVPGSLRHLPEHAGLSFSAECLSACEDGN